MNIRSYLYLGPIYAFTLGLLYVWGYWGSFDVNPLQYMGIEDVAKTAIIPLASTLLIFVLANLVSEFLSRDTFPYGGGPDTALRRFVWRHERFFWTIYLVALIAFALAAKSPIKWFVIAGWAGWGLAIILKRQGVLKEIQNLNFRVALLVVLSSVPIMAYAIGSEQAAEIANGVQYAYVVSSNIQAINEQINTHDPCGLRFIGRIGQTIFVMSYPEKRLSVADVGPGDVISTVQTMGCPAK